MREVDPQWTELAERYGEWIKEGDLKYRARELRRYEGLRELLRFAPPIEIEVGSNRGRFLKGLCKGRPDVTFVGVELKAGLSRVSRRRLERHELENGRVVHGDARLALPAIFDADSVQCVFVLFPDPWWKERHAKRRILDESFLRLVHRTLVPGGHLVVATDVAQYARATHGELRELGDLYQRVERVDVPGSETWAPTTRERHCQEDGIPVHWLYMRKATRSE